MINEIIMEVGQTDIQTFPWQIISDTYNRALAQYGEHTVALAAVFVLGRKRLTSTHCTPGGAECTSCRLVDVNGHCLNQPMY